MKKPFFKEITLMNTFLCFCVVVIHLTSSPLADLAQGSVPHLMVFIVNKILCFSVPSFIFLSGFKLYGKYRESSVDMKKFFGGRVMKIVVPYLISVAVYFLYFFRKGWVLPRDLPEYFFLGTLVAHFYYVVIAVQLYLLFPLIKYFFNKYPVATAMISLISTVVFNEFVHFNYSDRFFGTYIFYFVFGMVFAKYDPASKLKGIKAVSCIGYAVSAVIHLTLSYLSSLGKLTYHYAGIVNIVYVIFSIFAMYALFQMISSRMDRINKYAGVIGGVSYEIYLYHILVIFLLQYDVYPRYSLSVSEMLVISTVAVFALIHICAFAVNGIRRRKRSS